MSLVCTRMSSVCYSYVIRMSLVCTRMSFVCHSYVLVCHPYVTHLYSYVIYISLVCTRMSSVCHSYVLVCHPYITRMYSYVNRMSFVWGFIMNRKNHDFGKTFFIFNFSNFLKFRNRFWYRLKKGVSDNLSIHAE